MSENPYEPPQTVDQVVPLASAVSDVPAEFAVMAIGASQCAGAGRLYLIGSFTTGLFVLSQVIMDFGYRDDFRAIMPMLLCLVTSFVMFAWGMLRNISGMNYLRNNFLERKSRYILTNCLHMCWLKVPVVLLLFLKKDYFAPITLMQLLQEHGPVLGVVLIFSLTVYWHTRGINAAVKILGPEKPRYTSMLFTITGVAMIIAVVWTLYCLRGPQEAPWYLLLIGFMVLHFAAYTRAYQQLTRAFRMGLAS